MKSNYLELLLLLDMTRRALAADGSVEVNTYMDNFEELAKYLNNIQDVNRYLPEEKVKVVDLWLWDNTFPLRWISPAYLFKYDQLDESLKVLFEENYYEVEFPYIYQGIEDTIEIRPYYEEIYNLYEQITKPPSLETISLYLLPEDVRTSKVLSSLLKYKKYDSRSKEKFYIQKLLRIPSTSIQIFSAIFPELLCKDLIVWEGDNSEDDRITVYSEGGFEGLKECIFEAIKHENEIGINFIYKKNHQNIIWVNGKTKVVQRYDPLLSSNKSVQPVINEKFREFFELVDPSLTYIGLSVTDELCIQSKRFNEIGSDLSCEDYSLLYLIRRGSGMNHMEAVEDLIENREHIDGEIRSLYHFILALN